MTMPNPDSLSESTKLFILILTIVATELGSNVGLYMAIIVWLELDRVVRWEQKLISLCNKRP